MAVRPENFDYVRDFVYRQAAIVLEPGKEYLVETRLGPIAREEGFADTNDFIAAVKAESIPNGRHHRMVDALTTNETFFFRDHHPWEAMRKEILPAVIERKRAARQLAIWSAACSTGQEPYSIAMMLRDGFPQLESWDVKIIATDLSERVLRQAAEGRYSQFEVNRGLPAPLLVKHFTKVGNNWELKPEVRRMVTFRSLNLLAPFHSLPLCDVVCIRNVLIYFDVPTKRSILDNIRRVLHPQGSLLLGGGETTIGIHPGFSPIQHGSAMYFRQT